jgi:hypothetical protein
MISTSHTTAPPLRPPSISLRLAHGMGSSLVAVSKTALIMCRYVVSVQNMYM